MTTNSLLHAHDLGPWTQHNLVWPVAGHNQRLLALLEQYDALLALNRVKAEDGWEVGATATSNIRGVCVFLYLVAVRTRNME